MNYQIVLDKVISELNYVPKLLLHVCCAPCSSYVLEYLSNYFEITVFYYNPNINTDIEYNKRMEESKRLSSTLKTKYHISFVEIGYLNNEFEHIIKGLENEKEGGKRCIECYRLRLQKTAEYAKEHNFDYFTTTLTISPYKNSTIINKIASEIEKEYNMQYLYSDFKKRDGYKRSIVLSNIYNLYRQSYCGCKYSLKEREAKKNG